MKSIILCGVLIFLFGINQQIKATEFLPGNNPDLLLTDLSPLADSLRIAQRVQTPITYHRLEKYIGDNKNLRITKQAIDSGKEKWSVYVPEKKPIKGYGLIVWISPMPIFSIPKDWTKVLDENGLIFAMPHNAGNDQSTNERRIPLALHVYHSVNKSIELNPTKVFIGGFSGGSRVANRLAIAYPDIFFGALLMAGSDQIGERFPPPSTRELMNLLQSRSIIVYSTGQKDFENRANDGRSIKSMAAYCLSGVRLVPQSRLEHWIPNGTGFARAIENLLKPSGNIPDQTCLQRLNKEVEISVAAVRSALAAGQYDSATELLDRLDKKYGGMAMPDSVEIAEKFPATSH